MLKKHVLIPLLVGCVFCGVLVAFGKRRESSELIYMIPLGILMGAVGFVMVRDRYSRIGSQLAPGARTQASSKGGPDKADGLT